MDKRFIGRGNKAPYETVTIRIPKALYSFVYNLSYTYRAKVTSEFNTQRSSIYNDKSLQEAIDECQKIIKLKKGSKYSLEKLLKALYEVDVKLD